MAKLKEKKFGYVVQPPPPPQPYLPYPPPPGPIPPGMTMQDWTAYINSYIDVRARQLYDKLAKLITTGDISIDLDAPRSYIRLKDLETKKIHRLYIKDGIIYTQEEGSSSSDDDVNWVNIP